jgi:hypothetical protein
MAEYSVGFVILTLAWKESVDLVVSNIRNEPIRGSKPFRLSPDIAIGHRPSACEMPYILLTYIHHRE